MIFDTELESLLPKIEAIDHKKLKTPTTSIGVLVQEAFNLYAWMQDDLDILQHFGMPRNLPEELLMAAKACSEVQTRWHKTRVSTSNEDKNWQQAQKEALNLREELYHNFEFAFYGEESPTRVLNSIKKGTGDPNLIQDLSDLAALGKKYAHLLEQINFDLTLLDRSAYLSNTIGKLLAQTHTAEYDRDMLLQLRNKAARYLENIFTDVRRFGKFAFKDHPHRVKGYQLQYTGRKRNI